MSELSRTIPPPQPAPPVQVAPTHAPRDVPTPEPAEARQLPVPAGDYDLPEADPATPHDRYQLAKERLRIAEFRVRRSVQRLREAAHDLQPIGRIRAQPMQWVAGGLAFGLFLGWATSRRS